MSETSEMENPISSMGDTEATWEKQVKASPGVEVRTEATEAVSCKPLA